VTCEDPAILKLVEVNALREIPIGGVHGIRAWQQPGSSHGRPLEQETKIIQVAKPEYPLQRVLLIRKIPSASRL
jgi:hypothetical protein